MKRTAPFKCFRNPASEALGSGDKLQTDSFIKPVTAWVPMCVLSILNVILVIVNTIWGR